MHFGPPGKTCSVHVYLARNGKILETSTFTPVDSVQRSVFRNLSVDEYHCTFILLMCIKHHSQNSNLEVCCTQKSPTNNNVSQVRRNHTNCSPVFFKLWLRVFHHLRTQDRTIYFVWIYVGVKHYQLDVTK